MIQSLQALALLVSALWIPVFPLAIGLLRMLGQSYGSGNGPSEWHTRDWAVLWFVTFAPFFWAIAWAVLV